MNNFGLSEEILRMMEDSFRPFLDVEEVIIFGSRAMGNYKNGSDVDMALKGDKLTDRSVDALRTFFNQAAPGYPYKTDVVNYNTLDNLELKKHIDQYGKILYKRN